MSEYGYISSYEGLREWFLSAKTGKYSIYRGFVHSKLNNSQQFVKSEEFASAEDAFENLKKMLQLAGTGNFTIMVPSQTASMGVRTFFRLGGVSQVAGINGVQVQGINEAKVQGMISEAREKWEMERRIEDLEASADARLTMKDRIIQGFLDHPQFPELVPQIPHLIVSTISGLAKAFGGTAMPAQVGLSGYPHPQQPQTVPTAPSGENAATSEEEGVFFDGERVANAMNRIQTALPNQDVYVVLEKVAAFAETQPQMALQLLGQQVVVQHA